MKLYPVQREQVHIVWPAVVGLLERACKKGPTRDLDIYDLETACLSGKHQLWIMVSDDGKPHAAAVTGIWFLSRKVCEWVAFASDDPGAWVAFMKPIEEWAKASGCVAMRSYSRPGIKQRLPKEYKVKGYILEKALKDG